MAQRLKVPGGLQTRGMFEPSTFNEERGTVEVTFTTGSRGLRGGMFSPPYYEDLEVSERACDLSRLNNGAPYMDDHAYKRGEGGVRTVLGVVERAWIVNGQGRALLRFSDREEVKPVKRDVQTGILRHVSVGYSVEKYERTGEADGIPILTARRWQPIEISQTPLAFDDAATVRGRPELEPYEVEIEGTTTAAGQETRTMSTETTTAATAATTETRAQSIEDAAQAASEQRKKDNAERAATDARVLERAMQEESGRQLEIRKLIARTDLGDDFTERLIKERTSLDKVRELVLRHLDEKDRASSIDGHVRIGAGDDASEKFVRGACASIFQRAGTAKIIGEAAKNPLFADQFKGISTDPGEFRGMRLIDFARHSLELRGVNTRNLHGEALVKRALQFRDAGMNTTSDFTTLLETAVNKTFMGAYAYTPVSWRQWCGVKSLNDFRATTFYRPGAFGVLDDVTESGEVKHKSIPDGEKNSITPSTKGNIVGLTRRAIVNDDMGVFRDVAGGLGTAAALTIEAKAYGFLTANSGTGTNYPGDTHPLFYSTRNNIGPTGAMTIATIDGARATMAKQMDPKSNMYLNLRPSVWVGPVELEGQARVFNENATDPTANLNGVTNRVRGMLSGGIVGSAFLSAQSTTRHYFFADPAAYPVIAIGFIDGQEAPVITSQQSFEFDGLQVKITMDFGAAEIDFRGAITCAGA